MEKRALQACLHKTGFSFWKMGRMPIQPQTGAASQRPARKGGLWLDRTPVSRMAPASRIRKSFKSNYLLTPDFFSSLP
jgi:hypothetical protein